MSTATAVTVLVVDDHAPFRAAAAAVLARADGFVFVGEAVDGADAVRRADELSPALVVMDVRMPVLDGVGAARSILERRPETRVILCSTYAVADLTDVGLSDALAGDPRIAYVAKEELGPVALRTLWDGFEATTPRATPLQD